MAAKSTLAKSMLFLNVKAGETAEGKDVFKKIRIGFLDSKASDESLYKIGTEVENLINFEVHDIIKEDAYTVENIG